MLLGLYRLASIAARPLVPWLLARRTGHGKEDPARRGERLGHAGMARPPGRLVWVHGASVGESLAALPLIRALLERHADLRVLITSGTVTSARILADRLPARALHQFVPLDRPAYVARFLDHWRPDLAVWMESELWPNLLLETARRGVPAALVNARMSPRSAANWRRAPAMARRLLGSFRLICPASARDAERYAGFGAPALGPIGNIKLSAPPPGADPVALESLRRAMADRPVWLAASTHAGEEEAVAQAHAALVDRFPGLLTLLAPRHPDRGDAVEALLDGAGLTVARRSRGDLPHADTAVYLADTLGEMGLWLRLAPVAFIGGSLRPGVGGHTPIEAAQLGAALVLGPHMANFADMTEALVFAGGARQVEDASGLATTVAGLLDNRRAWEAQVEAAGRWAEAQGRTLTEILTRLEQMLAADGQETADR